MNKKEAIKLLICEKVCVEDVDGNIGGERVRQAYDMAIEALKSERPEIIRCKNCRHDNNCEIQYAAQSGSEFFCGAAERREP